MPFFRRGRKQDEENLQWLYRNLQELDETVTAREGAETEEAPAASDGDAGVDPATEPPESGRVVTEPSPSEPAGTEAPPSESVISDPLSSEPIGPQPPHVDIPAPIVGSSLLSQNEVTPKINETYERRNRQMSGSRRENAPFANRVQQAPQPRPKRQDPPPLDTTADTTVGRQSYFTGTFRSEKDLRIEGTFEGEIDCRGTVIVAKDATLSATVRACNIEIAGSVTGDVFIEERLHLRASGEMRGQSQAASFIVEEGGYFEGEMKMGSTDQTDWPPVGNGSSSDRLGRSGEPAQWTTKSSEGRPNRPSPSQTDSNRDDTGGGRHRNA